MTRRKRLLVGAGTSLVLHTIVLAALPGGSGVVAGAQRTRERSPVPSVAMLSAERAREILEPGRRRAAPALAELPVRSEDAREPVGASAHRVDAMRPLAWQPSPAAPPAPRVLFEESDAASSTPETPETLRAPRVLRVGAREEQTAQEADSPGPSPAEASPSDLASLNGIVLSHPPLAYPPTALRRGLEGRVCVGLRVDDAGRVLETWILRSSGSALLDRAARENLEGWRLDAERLARVAARRFRQEVRFELH